MTKWYIYNRKGDVLHESVTEFDGNGEIVRQDTLEYSGKWMGECFVTVSFKSAYPIDFQIGDYIEYRGERFCLNYDPSVVKKARRGSYGEGFVYDSVKFNSLSNELTEMRFRDWVLSDNKVHYTSLPSFSFYCKDVDDLVDRLQANSNRWCKSNGYANEDYWMFYTLRNKTLGGTDDKEQTQTTSERTLERARSVYDNDDFVASVKEKWIKAYGLGSDYKDSRDDERYDRNVSVSGQTVWDALSLIKKEFGLNFIIRGRNVFVGTAGIPTSHVFRYGKGNGLYEVDKTADQDQAVVTKLHAYGSNENLPTRYYAEVGTTPYGRVSYINHKDDVTSTSTPLVNVTLDLAWSSSYFSTKLENSQSDSDIRIVGVNVSDMTAKGRVYELNGKVCLVVGYNEKSRDPDSNIGNKDNVFNIIRSIAINEVFEFVDGVNKDSFPSDHKNYAYVNGMPNNMAVNSLMLPGFPVFALSELCKCEYDSQKCETRYYIRKDKSGSGWILFHTEIGEHIVTFSNDCHDPFIVSQNADVLGIREGDISCTEENDDNGLEKVYPTIEDMVGSDAGLANDKRLDEVLSADTIDDNGVYPKTQEEDKIQGFNIYLPELGFDLKKAAEDAGGTNMKISMKDGFCGGRTFDVTNAVFKNERWELRCKRSHDADLDLWFPYSYAKSVSSPEASMSGAYQVQKGDRYILTGIYVDDVNYVWAASVRLLRKAIHWLCKNDYTTYVYSPKIDEIYMAEEALAADAMGLTSIHDSIKEGDVLIFGDNDLKIDGSVYIDQLNIKENGNNGIATYDVTLRNEVNVGTIQRIQNKVDSLVTDVKSGKYSSGFTSVSQIEAIIRAYGPELFLSRIASDVAKGYITFERGLKSNGDVSVEQDATIGGDLNVKGNATLTDVVVDRVHDAKSTPAERVIVGAQGFDLYMGEDGKSHLYIDYLTARTKFFAASAEVRKVSYSGGTTLFSNAGSTIMKVVDVLNESKVVIAYKCYAIADDGTTKTMNWWHPGMMALCQTFNVKAGDTANLANRYYWRLVVGVGQETLNDGKLYDYVILSNKKTFAGNEAVVPIGSTQVIGWNGHPLVFGNVAIEVVSDGGMQSFATVVADYEGLTNDESGKAIASRVFYGYEPSVDGGEPDAPMPYDVIVQAGDQVQWGKYGNLIKLTTSVEDGVNAANAPSIAMYHNMGAPYKVGGGVNPYQWKTLTSLDSPELVLKNANNFKFFTDDDPNNIIDPITVSYEINASADFIIRKPTTQTATPTDMTFAVTKRTGSKVEDATATVNLFADYTTTDGATHAEVPINRLSDIGVSFYTLSSVTINAKDKSGGDTLATLSIPVLSDGAQGSAGAQGQPGQDGKNGKDAVEFVIKDAPMVFDTATDGVVPTDTSKTAKIYVYRGGANVSAQPIAGIVDQQGCSGARVTKLSDHFEMTLEGRYIKKDGGVSVTSGYVAVQFTYDGKAYVQQVPFLVNVAKFTGTVNANNKELSSKYTELSNKQTQTDKEVANLQTTLNGVPIKNNDDLTKYTSEIKQTAREISVEVSSEAVRSGRNMLLGSDFHRQGYGYAPNGTAFTESALKIRTYDGFAGCNSLFIEQTAIGNSYAGVRWADVPVTGGKTYVISAWLKRMSDTFGDRCSIIVHEYAGNGTTIAKNNSFMALDADADPKGTWRKKAITVTLQATTTRVNVIFCLGSTGAFSLCQPMMEEGTESNGWTLAPADYRYIMGNRIVGSLALTKNAALAQDGSTASIAGLYGTVIKGENGVATVERDAQPTKTQLAIVVQGYLKANTDYVLSFDVRRIDGKDDGCAFVSFVRKVLYSELYSGNVSIYSKENGNATESGYLEIKPSGDWQRVWVHFRLAADWTDSTGKNFNIGVFGGNGTGNSIRAQFRRPKLEACAAMTEYTEAQADYIEDENISKKLRRTGIDITNERITLDAKKTTVTGDLTVQGIITDSTSYVDVGGTLWSPNDVGELVNTKKNLKTNDGGVFAPIDMTTIKSLQIQTADPSAFDLVINPSPALVTLPMYNAVDLGCGITIPAYRRSGTHVLIRNGFSLAYGMWAKSASWGDAKNKYTALRQNIANAAVYICTDPRLLSLDNYKYASPTITPDGQDDNGASATAEWFKGGCFLNGRRGRWIALLPGQEIELVSVITMWKTGTNTAEPYLAWYVVGGSNIDWLDKLISIRPADSAYNGYEGYFEQEITGGQHFGVGSLDKYRDAFFGPRQLSDGYVDSLAAQTVVVTLSANEAPYLSVQ